VLAATSWSSWSFGPPLWLALAAAVLYALGSARTHTPPRARADRRWRACGFYAALVVIVVALCSPIDSLSDQLFWVHMVQHVLLLMVAAPLLVLAAPWTRLWRALPLAERRAVAGTFAPAGRGAPVRSAARALGTPAVSFVAFAAVLWAWHIPALFDATLSSEAVHVLEHTLFLLAAVMFWKQVIPSPPLRARLSPVQRVVYVIGAMIVSWMLAVVLALAPEPLYSHYAQLASRPGGISALGDQQLAAGIMWVPGSITFVLVVFAYVHRWLMPPPTPREPRAAELAGQH
jgi:cytochrome c oxidase assembly factor CtaG